MVETQPTANRVFHFDLSALCGQCWDNDEKWIGMDVERDPNNDQFSVSCPRCSNTVYINYTMEGT